MLVLSLFFGCNSENAWDCIQTSGDEISVTYDLDSFTSVLVNRDIEVIIQQGDSHNLTIVTGENLINDIKFEIVNNQLILTDLNTCNFVREFGITKMYVTAPNLIEIRSSTQYDIRSFGLLSFPELVLVSEDFNEDNFFNVGDFRMNVNSETLRIVSNNSSFFYISGRTENLVVGFFSGLGRFEGRNLIAANVEVFHRGSNDMLVNPQSSLTGELRGTGNVLSYFTPENINVERFYTGRLIFMD